MGFLEPICSVTNAQTQLFYMAWWVVDLGRSYIVENVSVTNRGDCCGKTVLPTSVLLRIDLS